MKGMDIRLARIDDRLIHGQITTVWTKVTKINRILVISDTVWEDQLRRSLLKQTAPPGVMVNVITVHKMRQIANDPRFSFFKVILLFTNPQDVVKVVKSGAYITSVNIGSMSYSEGKKMITNAVAVDQADVEAFHYLANRGIELEIRKVASDNKVDLMKILTKMGFIPLQH